MSERQEITEDGPRLRFSRPGSDEFPKMRRIILPDRIMNWECQPGDRFVLRGEDDDLRLEWEP